MHPENKARLLSLRSWLPALAALLLGFGGIALTPPTAHASPPAWAPANGYRADYRRDDHERDRRRGDDYEHDRRGDDRYEGDRRGDDDHEHERDDEGDRDRREREHEHERSRRREAPRVVQRAPRGWGPYINSRGECTWSQLDTALGGALGGVIGSQIGSGSGRAIATVGGVVLGALVGNAIGHNMDATDQYCAGTALRYAPPDHTVVWVDPHTRWHYRFVPRRRFKNQRGEECRHYTQEAHRGGRVRRHSGIACRGPRGSWHIRR